MRRPGGRKTAREMTMYIYYYCYYYYYNAGIWGGFSIVTKGPKGINNG